MRIGVLTGGGDCPGLNAVIRAVVRKGTGLGHEFLGFKDGWRGPIEGLTRPLGLDDVEEILARGGTILGSSRTNPYKIDGAVDRIRENLAELGVDALVAIGGEDTLGVAKRLTDDGIGVVGVPKTIDNDLGATDYTFGFDTAVQIAVDAIDRLHTTAESHHRVLIVEVMGRHAGWIALHSGMAAGANVILLPEQRFSLDRVCAYVESRFESHYSPILVVAEASKHARSGLQPLLLFMALISINLGVVNLLPIPVLDGGHIFIMAMEGVARRDFSSRMKEKMLLAGFVVLMTLMVTVIYNDLTRISWIERLIPWR